MRKTGKKYLFFVQCIISNIKKNPEREIYKYQKMEFKNIGAIVVVNSDVFL